MTDPSVLQQSQALRERTAELENRVKTVGSRNAEVRQHAWETRLRSRAIRDWAQAVRSTPHGAHHWLDDHPVRWFSVDGHLAGQPVWARWSNGVLRCDPRLRTQAQLVVDLGTVFVNDEPAARVEATLTGPPAAVMLTLAQACDVVTSIDFERVDADSADSPQR
jgi:hypothetical protein